MGRALGLTLLFAASALVLFAVADEARAATYDVTISGSRFTPAAIEIQAGDTVRWTNQDGIAHTSKSTGNWDTGTINNNGDSRSVTLAGAGSFDYFCNFHPTMTGTVSVLANAANSPPSINIISPGVGATIFGVTTLSGNVADPDAADVLTVSLRIDAGNYTSAPRTGSTWNYQLDTRALTNGFHTLTARVSDGKETTLGASLTVNVNNLPTIAIDGPADRTNVTTGSVLPITGRATSAIGTVPVVDLSLDGGPWQSVNGSSAWTYAWNTTALPAGDHTFQARVGDGVNLIATELRALRFIEPPPDQPPLVTIISPGEWATVSGLVNISGTASDPEGAPVTLEVGIDGTGYQSVTGRSGANWWYHWIPEGRAAGPFLIEARVSAGGVTVGVARNANLTDSQTPLGVTLLNMTPREGRAVIVRVLANATSTTPVSGARVYLSDANGTLLERVTNATGSASFPPLSQGPYTLRVYSTGAAGSLDFDVKGRYEINISATSFDFDRLAPLVVKVMGETPARGVDVEFRGPILPGNASGIQRTGSNGAATIYLQPLASGEVSLFVAGNDTGIRVQIEPTVLVAWSLVDPHPGDPFTATFTFNDLARTPVALTAMTVDLPGESRQELSTDAAGQVTFLPTHAGTLRIIVPRAGLTSIAHVLTITPPPAAAELSGLTSRPGPGILRISALVKNIGDGPGTFTVDGLAFSDIGNVVQATTRTALLQPDEEVQVTVVLQLGAGDYDITMSVRNSTAIVSGSARVVDSGIPPTPVPVTPTVPSAPAPSPGAPTNDSPGAPMGALAALALVAFARRRVG